MAKTSGGVRGGSSYKNANSSSGKGYAGFLHNQPTLYGQIFVNGKAKTGMFKAERNKYSNSVQYRYYTDKGKKGTGGFTMRRAYLLFKEGKLKDKPITWIR